METLRAIDNIARAEAAGLDGARTPGGMALRRNADRMNDVAGQAVLLVSANGLNPDQDKATQIRLAAAVDRQITSRASEVLPANEVTRAVMNDFYLQEAAARRMVQFHDKDPLDHLSIPSSARHKDEAIEILGRNGINSQKLLRTASKEDLASIASGKYDQIKSEHTRFGISTVLNLSDGQMKTPTARIPEAREPTPRSAAFSAPSLALGRAPTPSIGFGRKVSAER